MLKTFVDKTNKSKIKSKVFRKFISEILFSTNLEKFLTFEQNANKLGRQKLGQNQLGLQEQFYPSRSNNA